MYQKSILDLGCGYGDIGGALHRLGGNVTAVDARQEHLKMVAKKFTGIKTVCADLDRDWPFRGKTFDLILDLGLLCHLADYEKHLRDVCSSARSLILETAVCDSDDPNKVIATPENKGVFDLSYNGMGCRPSPAAIERVLQNNGMSFKRLDVSRFNSGDYRYDWQSKNDGTTNIDKRRIWFCSRERQVTYSPPAPPLQPQNQVQFLQNTYLNAKQQLVATPRPPASANPTPPTSNYVMIGTPSIEDIRARSQKYAINDWGNIPKYPNIRVLYLPLNDADNEQTGMYDAWRNVGVQWQVFDFYRQWLRTRNKAQLQLDLIKKVQEFQPHLIHMQLQFTGLIDSATLVECRRHAPGVIITNWSGDIRREAIFDFITLTHAIDYALISSTGQLEMYNRAGCKNVAYWQIGYDPKGSFSLNKKEFLYDASFIGNCYGHQFPDASTRAAAVVQLHHRYGQRFGLFGSGYGIHGIHQCSPRDVNAIYNNSICPVSISNFNNVSHYFSDRFLACVGSARPTISWYFPGIESYFQHSKEIFYARTSTEIIDHIEWCKNNPEKATEIGKAGQERALHEHTFTSRILELLDLTGLAK